MYLQHVRFECVKRASCTVDDSYYHFTLVLNKIFVLTTFGFGWHFSRLSQKFFGFFLFHAHTYTRTKSANNKPLKVYSVGKWFNMNFILSAFINRVTTIHIEHCRFPLSCKIKSTWNLIERREYEWFVGIVSPSTTSSMQSSLSAQLDGQANKQMLKKWLLMNIRKWFVSPHTFTWPPNVNVQYL